MAPHRLSVRARIALGVVLAALAFVPAFLLLFALSYGESGNRMWVGTGPASLIAGGFLGLAAGVPWAYSAASWIPAAWSSGAGAILGACAIALLGW